MNFFLVRLKSYPIYEQLLLEERLLRSTPHNWCLINEGSVPSIVMGISGKKEELIDAQKYAYAPLPLIKRFSGGGTVVVDEHTLFVTFICQKSLHSFPAYPEPIMRWAEGLFRASFAHDTFCLLDNDFVIGNRKCGGNAQYIRKDRWLHHTSFLWDYSEENMRYLLHPKKTPAYRESRPHGEFLCRLKEFFPCKTRCIDALVGALKEKFTLQERSLEEALGAHDAPESFSTQLLHL